MLKPAKVWHHIYNIGGPELSHPADCLVYVVDADDLVLIDSGAGESYSILLDNLRSLGFDPKRLKAAVATHRHLDHIGSLARWQRDFGVQLIAHSLEVKAIETGQGTGADIYGLPYEPCRVDTIISEPEATLNLGNMSFHFLHIPGHTPGSLAVWVEVEGKKVLFGQDIHGPYVPQWGGDTEQAITSLHKLLELEADILCEGHFGIFQPASAVREYIQGYLRSLTLAR